MSVNPEVGGDQGGVQGEPGQKVEPIILSEEGFRAAMEAAKLPSRAADSFGTPAVEPAARRGFFGRIFRRGS